MIKTIFCDLGNVIVYVDHKNISKGLAKFSDRSEKYIYNFFIKSKARKDFDKGKIISTRFFNNFKTNLRLNLNFTQFKKIWQSCFTGLNKDMEKLLYRLKKNYNLVLLSNTDEIHFKYCMEKYKVLSIFDDFILSYRIGHVKPSPVIFLKALKRTGRFPTHTLYIDDIKEFVKVSKLFGIKGIHYQNIEKLKKDLKQKNIKI